MRENLRLVNSERILFVVSILGTLSGSGPLVLTLSVGPVKLKKDRIIRVEDPGCFIPDLDPRGFSSRILHRKRDKKLTYLFLVIYGLRSKF
jgi:hypothetical protein